MNRRTRSVALASLAALSLVALAACGGSDTTSSGADAPSASAPADAAMDLSDVCPSTIVMQQDWQPEAEHGAWYALVGKGYTVDTNKKSVTGELVAHGVDTGVKIEIRSGGPAIGYSPVPAQMYLDKDILIGAVNTDEAIAASAKQPTVAVTSQLTVSPQIIMWDPDSHPGATTIKEAAADGDPVVTSGDTLPALLESKGIIAKSQSDTSYEGTPQRFVSDPTILQQGFATAEPYIYEHEVPQWDKPVSYQLMSDIGYSIYPEPAAVRAEDVTKQAPCLKKLVPILQQAQIDYLDDPAWANSVIVDIVNQYQTGWTYSEGVADFAVQQMKKLHLVTNDPKSGVFGKFDPDRVKKTVDTFAPIMKAAGTLKDDVDPSSLYTNQFIDDSIKLP